MKCVTHDLEVNTAKNNLAEWDPKLQKIHESKTSFVAIDLTETLQKKTSESNVQNGQMTLQVLHTTCILCVNELNEPMLLGDICRQMEGLVPADKKYLHNSDFRKVNVSGETNADQNGASHLKAFLVGNHTVTLLIRNRALVLGVWQRI